MNRSLLTMLGYLVLVVTQACSDDSGTPSVTFTNDIHPLLQMHCGLAGCHDSADSFLPGHGAADVDVAYTEVTSNGSSGTPVYQLILARIASKDSGTVMPPGCGSAPGALPCLSQADYDLIKEWVDEGHPK